MLIAFRSIRQVLACGLVAAATCGVAARAEAQANGPPHVRRVEWWGGATGVLLGPAGTLVSAYSPPLLLDGDFTSHAGQTLRADAGFALGVMGGLNVFPWSRVGFQLLVDRSTCDLKGANAPYVFALQYVSRQPPDDRPQIVDINRTTAWPDTSGSLARLAIAFNTIVRIGRPERVNVTLSGGPSYYRVTGSIEPLAFTAFHLGGHSVLFEDDHRLALALEPTHGLGFDLGGEVNAPFATHVALVLGIRFFGGSLDGDVVPTVVLNADEVTFMQPLDKIAGSLALAPMRLSVRSARVVVGLKVHP
jgi:hypothetical protein